MDASKTKKAICKRTSNNKRKVATSGTLTLAGMPLPHPGAVLNNGLGY
jgi:hypothetical protein